jgi:hypothetical protein
MVILNDHVRGIVFVFELSRVFMTRFCLFVFLIFLSEPQIIFLNNIHRMACRLLVCWLGLALQSALCASSMKLRLCMVSVA